MSTEETIEIGLSGYNHKCLHCRIMKAIIDYQNERGDLLEFGDTLSAIESVFAQLVTGALETAEDRCEAASIFAHNVVMEMGRAAARSDGAGQLH